MPFDNQNDTLNDQNDAPTTEEIILIENNVTTEKPKENPKKEIQGSTLQAFLVNSSLSFTSVGPIVILTTAITGNTLLNPVLKNLLVTSTLFSTGAIQIPVALIIGKQGGIKTVLALQGVAIAGMAGLTLLSACTDITTIDRFDGRYAALLISGILVGVGTGTFQLMINAIHWSTKPQQPPVIQAAFGGLVDSSNGLALIFLKNAQDTLGFTASFGIYTAIEIIGGLIGLKFLRASPYEQLRQKYSVEEAKTKAKAFGQLAAIVDGIAAAQENRISKRLWLKKFLNTIFSLQGITSDINMIASLGNFLVVGAVFPILLKDGFDINETEAIYAAAGGSLITVMSRTAAGPLIAKWDQTGIKLFLLSSGLIFISAVPIAFFQLPRWALYTSMAGMNIGFGQAIATTFSLASSDQWANPANPKLIPYEKSTMIGNIGTVGTLGGIGLSLLLGLLVELMGKAGYQNYFLLVMALVFVSMVLTVLTHLRVNDKTCNPMSFFRTPKNMQHKSAAELIELDVTPEDLDQALNLENTFKVQTSQSQVIKNI